MNQENEKLKIRGISVSNPVDVEKDYLLHTVDYAYQNGLNHIQFIGPIHDTVKGNIDGMTLYRKYNQFNEEKNLSYVMNALDAVRAACKRAKKYGIKTYVWHHELELPATFKEVYPDVKNVYGDIEITHPLIKDFLENKMNDFFHAYADIDGIILTLHETSIPLLKLKKQKLGKIERVKYVTEILYQACKALGKELIVRPFASIEEDYSMMAHAYEEVSTDMMIMDKWTQFDWSLTLPNNAFYHKIEKNPLFVEADIFGEFFGKGHLPIMLKEHMEEKFSYCKTFLPKGYVGRVDRDGEIPFDTVNEVNLVIYAAHLNGKNVDEEIDIFFETKYPGVGKQVRVLMEPTEEILRKTIYAKGLYYTELSYFPSINHSKNHFYFEMMREDYEIASDEWFIPRNWERGTLEGILAEKESAVKEANLLYDDLLKLQGKIAKTEYDKLYVKFCNLNLVTEIWLIMTRVFMDYMKYFETGDDVYEELLQQDTELLSEKNQKEIELLGDAFYCLKCVRHGGYISVIDKFVEDVRKSFELEKKAITTIAQEQGVLDYVVCGGATEGHRLQKEVNFSATLIQDDMLCRIPGITPGTDWCSINAHGWFSYEVGVTPYAEQKIKILLGSSGKILDVGISIGADEYELHESADGMKIYEFIYRETEGASAVRIRFDKISGDTPMVYWIKVMKS